MTPRAAVPPAPHAPRAGLALLIASALTAGGALPLHAGSFGVEALGGYFGLQATRSARAVFDGAASGGPTFGGAVRYVHRTGFYLAAGARTFSKDGQRAFVASASGPVAHLGFPLHVRITPVFGTLGYRFQVGRLLTPYLGAGGGVTAYSERSDVAGDVREESRSKGAFHGVVGVEVGSGTWRVGAEGVYSSVSDGLGMAGVSRVYGERDLGGFSALGKLVVSFGR